MRLGGGQWLTYCLNVHPAESWAETRAALEGPAASVGARLAPDGPFAVGLRLSARAVAELEAPEARGELCDLLERHDLRAVTVNGFPYGPFHGRRVKEAVYLPDWRDPARLAYTCGLAELMAAVAPGDEAVSLSTVPGGYKPALGDGDRPRIAAAMVDAAARLARLEQATGVSVRLAVEPEPFCMLETIEEAVAFFTDHLYGEAAVARMARGAGLGPAEAAEALPRHLGLCYDVCHAAVEFEDADRSIAALRSAGIPIHKLQLSSALGIERVDAETRQALGGFAEPTYLHQVIGRGPRGAVAHSDLPQALARGAEADGEEWRVHFHVPVFVEALEHFGTTQAFLARILELHRAEPISPHLEVETYTWSVLPPDLQREPLDAAIARELEWVRERLQ